MRDVQSQDRLTGLLREALTDVRTMKLTPFTNREQRILISEIRLAARDSRVITGSIFGGLSVLSLAEVELTLPPLEWLVSVWSKLSENFWLRLCGMLPLDVSLSRFTTDSASLFVVVGAMFYRGHRAGFRGQNAFSFLAQDFLARLLFYLLLLFSVIRAREPLTHPIVIYSFEGRGLTVFLLCIGFLTTAFFLFRWYVRFLRRRRIVPKLLEYPWLILLGPTILVLFQALTPEYQVMARPEELDLMIVGVLLLNIDIFLANILLFFGTPLAFWFVRVFVGMAITISVMTILDSSWSTVNQLNLWPRETQETAPIPVTVPGRDTTNRDELGMPDETALVEGEFPESPDAPSPDQERELQMNPEVVAGAMARQAVRRFSMVLGREGTPGLILLVEDCYNRLDEKSSRLSLDRCLCMDTVSTQYYEIFARNHEATTEEGLSYFLWDPARTRMIKACTLQGLHPNDCRDSARLHFDYISNEMNDFIGTREFNDAIP